MASQAQIEANRRNSKKSTGPVSAEGKAVCSQNALQSGIYAFSHVIRGEDPEELDALKAAFLQHHEPADATQLALVDTLIATECTNAASAVSKPNFGPANSTTSTRTLRAPKGPTVISSTRRLSAAHNPLEAFICIESTNRMFLRTFKAPQDFQKASADDTGQPNTRPRTRVG